MGIFALLVAVMSSVAWVFAGTEPAPPPEEHPAKKSRTGEAIHAAISMRLHDSNINLLIEQTSALCSATQAIVYFPRKEYRVNQYVLLYNYRRSRCLR